MTSPISTDLGSDLPVEEFRALAHEVADWAADYLGGVGSLPVLPGVRPGDVRSALPATPPLQGESLTEVLSDFRDVIVPGLTHWNHPSFFGYFAMTGSGPGILAEMLTAALNVNAMVWRSSPSGTELEELIADWLRQLLGLPPSFDGVINDTASSSSLHALAAAREEAYPNVRNEGMFQQNPGRIYASEEAHSSIEKATLTLGFGRSGYQRIKTDGRLSMCPAALRSAIQEDVALGLKPVAVVTTLGTTSTAALDPVREVADVAQEFGLWLHVDAAYGGPAAIVPELRELFDGWEMADSIVVNPHKWLFTPVDCSLLYCRRPEVLIRAFSIVPEYLKTPETGAGRNLMDYGVPLGRRFRALKLWFVLRYFGRQGIVDRLRSHVALAQELAAWIDAAPAWERVAPAPLSLVAFRFVSKRLDGAALDDANHRIMERVNESGEAFLTHTVVRGRTCLRVSIGNLKTTHAHVRHTWKLLQEAATYEGGSIHP
ncbi:MAG TPA: amino acid decarboxylase [Gemmatimonadetes bacterium]|nr:amino acid decarboxylase [Gemmatimonadota bacterium]